MKDTAGRKPCEKTRADARPSRGGSCAASTARPATCTRSTSLRKKRGEGKPLASAYSVAFSRSLSLWSKYCILRSSCASSFVPIPVTISTSAVFTSSSLHMQTDSPRTVCSPPRSPLMSRSSRHGRYRSASGPIFSSTLSEFRATRSASSLRPRRSAVSKNERTSRRSLRWFFSCR